MERGGDPLRARSRQAACPAGSPDSCRGGRWWGVLSVAVQQAVASTALGRTWPAQPQAGPGDGPPLDHVLGLADAAQLSRMPLRP